MYLPMIKYKNLFGNYVCLLSDRIYGFLWRFFGKFCINLVFYRILQKKISLSRRISAEIFKEFLERLFYLYKRDFQPLPDSSFIPDSFCMEILIFLMELLILSTRKSTTI